MRSRAPLLQTLLKQLFGVFNRVLMVPLFRLGLGLFIGNPLTGYIMVLKTVGRKTGKLRYTPVNYAILNGQIYCVAGFGQTSLWYRNLQAQPRLELLMPGGAFSGVAETVSDPAEAVQALRQVLISAGFAGYFYGFNPRTVAEARLRELTDTALVIRIRPDGLGNGAGDAGGWLWLLVFVMSACLLLWLWRK